MGNHLRRLGCLVAVSAALGLGLGCGGKNKKNTQDPAEVQGDTSSQVSKIDPTLCESEGKEVENYDLNDDGRPDVWKLYKLVKEKGGTSRVLTCKQADLNFDGKKDYVVAFNDAAGIMFEKFDLDFQQGFDAFYKYEEVEGENAKSLLYEVQRDSNFDGKYDIIEKYDTATGLLTEVQRDTNGDLKPDVWEQYDKGVLVAILYDDDPYDGKVDRREEIAVEEEKPVAPPTPEGTEPAADDA
ncbi:MAG TPA: hypothetical protein VML75_25840 [Kofleriaceae bacterium]|nr:hypothetical protein [Kofleriaceae bacterium]